MIYYTNRGFPLWKLFRLRGSVFPYALVAAVPNGLITALLIHLTERTELPDFLRRVLGDSSIWTSFCMLVGFLAIFRAQHSYGRFRDGLEHLHCMGSSWFSACSGCIACCKFGPLTPEVQQFESILIRLFSLLHGASLCTISEDLMAGTTSQFELIDAAGLDDRSIHLVSEEVNKVHLIYHWILSFVIRHLDTQVLNIPSPLLVPTFNHMSDGISAYQQACAVTTTPFPWPYAQVCDFLLIIHWILVPFVVFPWSFNALWGFAFTFSQVFVLWALHYIAVELEFPFGADANDLDSMRRQEEFNSQLRLLLRLRANHMPSLKSDHVDYHQRQERSSAVGRDRDAKAVNVLSTHTELVDHVNDSACVRFIRWFGGKVDTRAPVKRCRQETGNRNVASVNLSNMSLSEDTWGSSSEEVFVDLCPEAMTANRPRLDRTEERKLYRSSQVSEVDEVPHRSLEPPDGTQCGSNDSRIDLSMPKVQEGSRPVARGGSQDHSANKIVIHDEQISVGL